MDATSDAVTGSGGVVSVDATTAHRGSVYFSAPEVATYGITYTSSVTMVNSDNPSRTMSLSPSVDLNNFVVTSVGQVVDVQIGGTITFGSSALVGAYSGDITIYVDII